MRSVALAVLLAAAAGCAALGGLQVDHARTGEVVVRVGAATTFERIARSAYGDSSLARQVALVSHFPENERVPGGTVLVLPVRDRLEERVSRAEDSNRSFERGLEAADRGSYRTAADHFRRALDASPGRIEVRYNLGLALMQAGELSRATALLESVALARPDDAESRYAFGTLLRRRRAHARAYGEFDAALRLDPGHAKSAFARAKTLEDLGETARAEAAWRRFLSAFPDHPLGENARRSLQGLDRKRDS